MTTIVTTDDYMLADRLVGIISVKTHGRMKKIHMSPDKRMAIGIGGTVDYKDHHKDVAKIVFEEMTKYLAGDKLEKENPRFKKLLKSVTVHVLTRDSKFLITEGIISYIVPGLPEIYGTGDKLAATFIAFGMPPEKIIPAVSKLDVWSTREFDIIYKSDLKA